MFLPTPASDTQHDYAKLDRKLDQVKSSVFRRGDAAFFGPILCGLDHIWTTQVDTAGTDGQHLYWNPDFFVNAPIQYQQPEFNEFVLMHELWHVARLHMLREGKKCPDKWNEACDIRINNDEAAEYQIRKKNSPNAPKLPWGTFPAWFKPEWDKENGAPLAEEEIYARLNKIGAPPKPNPWGNGDMVGDAEANKAAVATVVKAIQSAKMAGQPGAIPGGVVENVNKFLSPVIPWEYHLKKWMTDLLEYDYTWARPNRRYADMYLPSIIEEDGRLDHLIYFQDVSGSISSRDIIRFNSELKYVWDELKPKRMTVVQFDTIIQKIDEFNEGDTFDKIKIIGRGGTCLIEVRQMIEDLKPTAAVIFTDMGVAPMRPLTHEIPILWVCTNNPGAKVPFGTLIHIKT